MTRIRYCIAVTFSLLAFGIAACGGPSTQERAIQACGQGNVGSVNEAEGTYSCANQQGDNDDDDFEGEEDED